MESSGKLSIKQWSEEDRPREKLLAKGKENLSDAELVAILLGSGFKDQTAVDVAKTLLLTVNNDLDMLGKLSVGQISKLKGIGPAKAISIVSALELGRRRKFTEKPKASKVTCAKDVWDYMYPHMADLDHERFYVLLMNRANHIHGHVLISQGGVSGTVVDAKLVFRKIFETQNAIISNIIICHNHPSGSLKPSNEDISLTKKIKEGGRLLDITVFDHLIFTNESYFSFADEGMI
jgi:DNA repair protein RadC